MTRRPNTFYLSLQMGPYGAWSGWVDVRYVGSRSDVYYESQLGPSGALNTVGVEEYQVCVDRLMGPMSTTRDR